MTYESFLRVIKGLKKAEKDSNDAYKLNIDLLDFVDPYNIVITELIKEIYGAEGYDWLSWFCYENDFGQGKLQAWDKDKNLICYSLESLHQYLEENYKKQVMEEVEYLSLFDYLGKAAGSELGKQVANKANELGIKHQTKEVSNPKYSGPILMYPKSFLDEYFVVSQEDDLPY